MATQKLFSRVLPKTLTLAHFSSRSLSTSTTTPSFLRRFRPLSAASIPTHRLFLPSLLRSLSTSSRNDPKPKSSNRPSKENIDLPGCDLQHWIVFMEKPEGEPSREEIIDTYIKTLAQVIGTEDEARMKIYSVSTKHYFAFGALVSEELSDKIKELPNVQWVLPDSYLNVNEKDYGGEPFVNGVAAPYDPKYHEEWVRNNAQTNEKSGRNDRPRNNDSRGENAGGSASPRPGNRGRGSGHGGMPQK